MENLNTGNVPVLFVEFESFKQPVAFPAEGSPVPPPMKQQGIPPEWDKQIEEIIAKDLGEPQYNKLLWHWRWCGNEMFCFCFFFF